MGHLGRGVPMGWGGEAGLDKGKPDLRRSEEISPLELGPGHSENQCELSLLDAKGYFTKT